jgi:hypothetical protein
MLFLAAFYTGEMGPCAALKLMMTNRVATLLSGTRTGAPRHNVLIPSISSTQSDSCAGTERYSTP